MKRLIVFLVLLLMFVSGATAANVTVDGERFAGAKLINSVTYVPIRAFSESLADCNVSWDNDTRSALVGFDGKDAVASIGKVYLECAGRIVYSGNENRIIDGSTYVPIRSIAKVLGADVSWDAGTKTAVVRGGEEAFSHADDYYDSEDLYWLSKIISAESAGEELRGKIAVGNVVMNRVRNSEYPNSIYEVIFDTKNGVQFTPVANGTINNAPTEESVLAAKICLENYSLTDRDILFFLNPQISTSTWVPDNRDFIMTIGRHDFYA